jgi:hypothetical protein
VTQIRGVFPLPQTNPQLTGTVQVVTLASGGVYVLPAGNFLVTTGANTALEWFDPLAATWRPLQPHQSMGFINTDGCNYRLLNMTGTVTGATIGTAGSGGANGIGPVQTGTTLSIPASTTGAVAAGYVIIGGSVPAPTIIQPGTAFLVPPIICCDPPPVYGIQATFTCTINAQGGIATVTQVNPGAGYTSVPQFYVVPQPMYYEGMPRWPGDPPVTPPWPATGWINQANVWPGTVFQPNITRDGALIMGQPLSGSGTITGVNIIYGGGGYSAAPTATIAGGTLTGTPAVTLTVGAAAATDTSYLQWKVN